MFIQQHIHHPPTGVLSTMHGALVSAVLQLEVELEAYCYMSSPAFFNKVHRSLWNTDSICCTNLFLRDKEAIYLKVTVHLPDITIHNTSYFQMLCSCFPFS